MRRKKLNKKNITKLLIEIQDRSDLIANSIATRAIEEYGLQREHQRQTRKEVTNERRIATDFIQG